MSVATIIELPPKSAADLRPEGYCLLCVSRGFRQVVRRTAGTAELHACCEAEGVGVCREWPIERIRGAWR